MANGFDEHKDLIDLAIAIESGELTAPTLVDGLLDRIERLDGKLGAFTSVFADDARNAAEAAHLARKSGHAVSPVHGIPFAVKDVIDVAGYPTHLGSRATLDAKPATRSAEAVEAAQTVGMIALGKTNTVEYALGGWGMDPDNGAPWNPNDMAIHRIPGGSSSGSTVAVAAGLVPAALGTDTGGSIRMPASFCGVVGLKTTVDSVSRKGAMELSTTLDTVGPLVRSVRDAELMLAILGNGGRSAIEALLARVGTLDQNLAGCRLAILPDREREGVSEATLASFDATLDVFRKLGATIEVVDLPPFSDLAELTSVIMLAEAYAVHRETVDNSDSGMGEIVTSRMALGKNTTAHAYIDALARREAMRARYFEQLGNFHALLTPSTEITAIPLVDVDQIKAPARFTRLGNLVGCFAMSIPNGVDAQGLPTGLQLMATQQSAANILHLGKVYQAVTEWHLRRLSL